MKAKKKTKAVKYLKEKFDSVQFTTPAFTLSYPTLDKPKQYVEDGVPKGEPQFTIEMLFEKNSKALKKVKAKIKEAARNGFGDHIDDDDFEIDWPVFDGDEKQGAIGYEGNEYIRAKNQKKPVLLERNKQKTDDASIFYGGCVCDAVINARAYQVGDKCGIALYVQCVRFLEDGTPFGGHVDVDKAFPDMEDEDDTDEDSDADEDADDDEGGWI